MMMKTKPSLVVCKTIFLPLLGLLFLIILARGAWAKCSAQTFDSTCICINDSHCHSNLRPKNCNCLHGQEVTLQQLVEHLIQTGGVVEYLFISGSDLDSLNLLDGHLKELRHDLAVVETALQSLISLNGIETNGNVAILGNKVLRKVSGLSSIKIVGGLVIQDNPTLSDVNGLGNVTQVGGDLVIQDNPTLLDVDGLGNVTQVGGDLVIQDNLALLDVNGLGNVTQVGGDLVIQDNPSLLDVNGLGNVAQMGGYLVIQDNLALSDVNGLGNVTQVGGDLVIQDNPTLLDVDGLGNVTQVGGDLVIQDNLALLDVNGLGNVTQVGGDLVIQDNPTLLDVDGLGNVTQVDWDLRIENNTVLSNLNGLGNIIRLGRDLAIQDNPTLLDVDGLGNVVQVDGDLILSSLFITSFGERLFENLVDIGGSLSIDNCIFNSEIDQMEFESHDYVLMPRLTNVFGSIVLQDNEGLSLTFEKLQNLCIREVDSCTLKIHNNHFHRAIYTNDLFSLDSLNGFNGSLSIMQNVHLRSISFKSLVLLRGDWVANEGHFDGGLTISFNPDLEIVEGFDSLEIITGNLEILGNGLLNYINLKALTIVAGSTRIIAGIDEIGTFTSSEALPYFEGGCQKWQNIAPTSSVFTTNLFIGECTEEIDTLTPILVGFAIIAVLLIVSLLLLYYLSLAICSSYQERIPLEKARDMFASHLLALADVLSDIGFVATVFVVWDSKSSGGKEDEDSDSEASPTTLLVIGVAGTLVVVASQLFAVSAVYWGLLNKHTDEDGIGKRSSLMDHLKEQKAMQTHNWLLLFPGLLLLDVEVIKHLPWGKDLKVSGKTVEENGGFPAKYFGWVAYIATLVEDLPQVGLQIFFIIVNDEGWAVTAALASLTLSMADIMVKLVFPPLVDRLMDHSRRVYRRTNAIDKMCPLPISLTRGQLMMRRQYREPKGTR